MSDQLTISLVLATVGRTDELARCLKSLADQTDNAFEVLVIDQNPDDRLVRLMADAATSGLNLRHIRLDRPSLARARNLGIANSTGCIIGFPDDDCWFDSNTVAMLRQAFLQDEQLGGLVACWAEQSAARHKDPQTGALSCNAWRNFRGGDASSISLFFRRTVFDKMQGFDERLGIGQWYGAAEETDLLLRVLESGHAVAHCPGARVHHLFGVGSTSKLQVKYRSARSRARGTGAIYAKHRLGYWVIFRGLLAPLLKPIVAMQGWEKIILGSATFIGRLEGAVRWRWEEKA